MEDSKIKKQEEELYLLLKEMFNISKPSGYLTGEVVRGLIHKIKFDELNETIKEIIARDKRPRALSEALNLIIEIQRSKYRPSAEIPKIKPADIDFPPEFVKFLCLNNKPTKYATKLVESLYQKVWKNKKINLDETKLLQFISEHPKVKKKCFYVDYVKTYKWDYYYKVPTSALLSFIEDNNLNT